MLIEFLNFLGLDGKTINKNISISKDNAQNIEKSEHMEEYVIEMQSQYFKEEITRETIIKDGKKIEIKKIKTAEPLNNGKTLITTKFYKKDISRT
ncbi:TPA: hypothetical protein RQJ16_001798 [Campylobacter fetus subsp. venerealis]|nr:hypothetical protein [Campylobacter fetus subsp. venerealis]HDX6295200.1 hypothetical protein [Campylobacter fetus subsp. venerealis]HDX6309304.1 hypothetical protein [Campylobacter fetus subsp. venerealis]HDX8135951.1 hypothetical protein [Campylobacter fetus subsp. venerealis]